MRQKAGMKTSFKSSELHVVVTDNGGITLHVTLLCCVKFAEM